MPLPVLCPYASPLGPVTVSACDGAVSGLWFDGQKYDRRTLPAGARQGRLEVHSACFRWLDEYFAGKRPDFLPPLEPEGTAFQKAVWAILLRIPYGETMTYGEIAAELAAERGLPRMSAQAVGGAVGHNPISILIPCHRVVGTGGSLTGYAGGLSKKQALLRLEGVDVSRLRIPVKGTAL